MLLVPKIYTLAVIGMDLIMLITVLLFRKPKPKIRKSTLGRRYLRLIGYYLIISALVLLVLNHYAIYLNYLDYFEGLAIDNFLFYLGLKVVVGYE